ncbi:MAG: intradiol ring-cleavage dioxygenase [Cyclobacteriaceae bacterium]|nr:MAG: intradiol ring-cleavage dioxygenase [Cyclobacteriaceae bacterium]
MKYFLPCLLVLSMAVTGCAQSQSAERQVGGGCEDCELMFAGMPATLSWKTKLAPDDEPGERMIISGTIYKKDGKTPAPDVILYVYQTDNTGRYTPAPKQVHAKRHGHLRGWVKTDAQGRYEFSTIRPASYPNSRNPQHIHPIIKEPGLSLYWIDEFLFEDDPVLTVQDKTRQAKRGGSGIITLSKNAAGVWIGKRDIILGINVPNY